MAKKSPGKRPSLYPQKPDILREFCIFHMLLRPFSLLEPFSVDYTLCFSWAFTLIRNIFLAEVVKGKICRWHWRAKVGLLNLCFPLQCSGMSTCLAWSGANSKELFSNFNQSPCVFCCLSLPVSSLTMSEGLSTASSSQCI